MSVLCRHWNAQRIQRAYEAKVNEELGMKASSGEKPEKR
jgi:hypothetical protein